MFIIPLVFEQQYLTMFRRQQEEFRARNSSFVGCGKLRLALVPGFR
jgi:hypothetical protein